MFEVRKFGAQLERCRLDPGEPGPFEGGLQRRRVTEREARALVESGRCGIEGNGRFPEAADDLDRKSVV